MQPSSANQQEGRSAFVASPPSQDGARRSKRHRRVRLHGRPATASSCGNRSRPLPHRAHRSNCWSWRRSEEHTSELQSLTNLVCRLLLEKKKKKKKKIK